MPLDYSDKRLLAMVQSVCENPANAPAVVDWLRDDQSGPVANGQRGGTTTCGAILLASAGVNAPKAPKVSYMIGTFLPGLLCLIISLKQGQTGQPKPGVRANDDGAEPATADWVLYERSRQADNARADARKFSAAVGIGCGILLPGLR